MTFNETRKAVEWLVESLPKRELVSNFVSIFSRFEYALKATGFFVGDEDRVDPDWCSFAKHLPILRDCKAKDVQKAIAYFDSDPPRKQVYKDGVLDWRRTETPNRDNDELLVLVRRVRNNLFHGGKVPFKRKRDAELLRSAEAILIAALSFDDGLREKFLEADAHATM
jgi:hypothetical protein